MSHLMPAIAMLSASLLSGVANSAPIIFDFEDQSSLAEQAVVLTTLALTKDSLTATVARPGGTFEILGFANTTYVLAPTAPYTNPAQFVVDFSQLIGSASVQFGDVGEDLDTLVLEAFSGRGATGAVLDSEAGSCCGVIGGGYQTKTLTVAANGIASIRFIGGGPDFPNSVFYDDIAVDTSTTVPEPAALGLFGLGWLGIIRWRARSARMASGSVC